MRRKGPLLSLLLLVGCSLDEHDLDAFQHTAMGPSKLRAVLQDETREPRLRALAALSLLDLERADLDGRAALFQDLSALEVSARSAIVPGFEEGLRARMRTREGETPSADAVRAKDAGVELLALLEPKERARLGASLLTWMGADLDQRADRGTHRLEAVAKMVGPEGARALVKHLAPGLVPRHVLRLARIVNEHAEADTRALSAEKLVAVEAAYRAPEHIAFMRNELARELFEDKSHDEALLDAQLTSRHLSALLDELLPALGLFADQATTRAHLLSLARLSDQDLAIRSMALTLLEGHVTQAELPTLLELATNAREAPELRALAVVRAGETRSRDLVPTLLSLVSERNHAQLRQRAGELVLELGGPETLPLFFRSLPHHWDSAYDKREIDAYAERLVRFAPDNAVLMFLGDRLHSSAWWQRILALRYFAARGTIDHVWRIRQHLADPHLAVGKDWPRGYSVGQEAQVCLNIALERLRGGQGT